MIQITYEERDQIIDLIEKISYILLKNDDFDFDGPDVVFLSPNKNIIPNPIQDSLTLEYKIQ